MREFRDNLLFRAANQRTVARESLDLHRMALELLFDVVGCRLADLRGNRIGILDEFLARHVIADAEEDQEAPQENRQECR